jgi:hypothetical protein
VLLVLLLLLLLLLLQRREHHEQLLRHELPLVRALLPKSRVRAVSGQNLISRVARWRPAFP